MPSTSRTPARSARRLRLVSAGLAAAMGVSLFLALPSLRPVVRELDGVSPLWLAGAVALEVASCASFVAVFRLMFERVAASDARQLAWTSMATNVLVPGGGIAALAINGWLMRLAGAPVGWIARRSSALFVLTTACNGAAMVGAGVLLLVVGSAGDHDLACGGLPILVCGAAGALVFTLPRIAKGEAGAGRRRWASELLAGVGDARRALANPHGRLLGAVGYLGFDIAVLWATFSAVGAAPSPTALILGYSAGQLARLIPVPGGAGVLDAGLAGALALYGAPAANAAAAVLLYHAIAFWVPAVGGLMAYARLRRPRNLLALRALPA